MQSGARWAASASSKSRPLHHSSLPALVTATPPERPQRVMAKPDEVGTGSRPSGIIEGVMSHDPIAMVYTAARAVRLYVSINVNLRLFLEDRRGVNK